MPTSDEILMDEILSKKPISNEIEREEVLECMRESAIEFANWTWNNNWMQQGKNMWWNFHEEIENQKELTTEQLYTLFINRKIK